MSDNGNGFLTKAELMSKRERRFLRVELPDLPAAMLRSLDGREMGHLRKAVGRHRELGNEMLIVHTAVDPTTREPLLTEADAVSGALSAVDSKTLEILANAAADHIGWLTDYEAKEITAEVKN